MDFTTPNSQYGESAKTPKLGSGARFAAVEKQAAKRGASDPAAVAAAAGRKKYGNAKMAKLAKAGRHKEATAFEGFPVHSEPEMGLKEYNHNHDAKGEFSSGTDTGSGGGPGAGAIVANPNSSWHSQAKSIKDLKHMLSNYKGWSSDVRSGRTSAGERKGFGDARPQSELDAERAKFEQDKPELLRQYDQNIADLNHAIGQRTAYAASKRAASAATKSAEAPAMHNGVELTPEHLGTKSIAGLASIVSRDWRTQGNGVNYAAKPYLDALHSMQHASDNYGADSGHEIVARFLGNATSWRGPVAKAVKAELNRRLKGK